MLNIFLNFSKYFFKIDIKSSNLFWISTDPTVLDKLSVTKFQKPNTIDNATYASNTFTHLVCKLILLRYFFMFKFTIKRFF